MSSKDRFLKRPEITALLKGVKKDKEELNKILKSKIKVYKLTEKDLKEANEKIQKVVNKTNIPRFLKENELNQIVDVLKPPPSCIEEISVFNLNQIKKSLKEELSTYKISVSEKTIPFLQKKIEESYYRSLVRPGESVGINGAMSMGQMFSQLNLDAFHSAGSSNELEASLKSIEELFNVSSNRKKNITTVHFQNKNLTKEEIFLYNKALQKLTVQDLIRSEEVLLEVKKEDEYWYKNYEIITGKKINRSSKFLRLQIQSYKCYLYGIFLNDIVKIIEDTAKSESEKVVHCVASPTNIGIIDIHVDESFVSRIVDEFITKGKSFANCQKRTNYKRGRVLTKKEKLGLLDEDLTFQEETVPIKAKTYINSSLDLNDKNKDVIHVFLTVILKSCFKDMHIMGTRGIENIRPVSVNLTETIQATKFGSEPELLSKYKLKEEEFKLIYIFTLSFYSINILGIPVDKVEKFIESCGIKIIDKFYEGKNPSMIIKMPEVPDEKYKNSEGKMVNRFVKRGTKVIDMETKKELVTAEQPQKLLNRKLKESEELLKEKVKNLIEKENFNENLDFPEIYRNGFYCYAKIDGKGIIHSLFKNKLVDKRFTFPEDVNVVNKMFGIEASRLYFIKEYTSNGEIKKMNPANIELLVDFQTNMGQLLAITSSDVYKFHNSPLASASFEQPIHVFQKAASTGRLDEINSISSCIYAGKKCRNGTGLPEVLFDEEYLGNEKNKVSVPSYMEKQVENVKDREILGSCFAPGKLEVFNEETDEIINLDLLKENEEEFQKDKIETELEEFDL